MQEEAVEYCQRRFPRIQWYPHLPTYMHLTNLEEELTASSTNLVLFPLATRFLLSFAERSLLRPLQKDVEIPFDTFHPLALKGVHIRGQCYGVPEDVNLYGLFIRKDRLPAGFLEKPLTWDSIIEYATRTRRVESILSVAGGGPEVRCSFLFCLLAMTGLDPRAGMQTFLANDEKLMAAYSLVLRLVDRKLLSPSRLTSWSRQEPLRVFEQDSHLTFYVGWMKRLGEADPAVLENLVFRPLPPLLETGQPILLIDTYNWCIPANAIAPELGLQALQKIIQSETRKKAGTTTDAGYPSLRKFWTPSRRDPLFRLVRVVEERSSAVRPFFVDADLRQLEHTFRIALSYRLPSEDWLEDLRNRVHGKPANIHKQLIKDALAFIEKNLAKIETVEDVAGALRVSPSHFRRLFKSETGQTCWDYITQYKMEVSRKLLGDLSLSIKEIAHQLGFPSSSAFSHAFNRFHGMGPRKMRCRLPSDA